MGDRTVGNLAQGMLDLKLKDNGDGSFVPQVAVRTGSNVASVRSFRRTLVADTDVALPIPTGTKLVFVYHALATPVFGKLNGAVTLPAAGAAGQDATAMFPPSSPTAYALWDTPTIVGTNEYHIRSASAGDVWVTFASE